MGFRVEIDILLILEAGVDHALVEHPLHHPGVFRRSTRTIDKRLCDPLYGEAIL